MSLETSARLRLNIPRTFLRDISVHEIGTEFPLPSRPPSTPRPLRASDLTADVAGDLTTDLATDLTVSQAFA